MSVTHFTSADYTGGQTKFEKEKRIRDIKTLAI